MIEKHNIHFSTAITVRFGFLLTNFQLVRGKYKVVWLLTDIPSK